MSILQVSNIVSNGTLTSNVINVGISGSINTTVYALSGNVVINTSSISVGNSTANVVLQNVTSVPAINVAGTLYTNFDPTIEECNVQIFTSSGTWVRPSWLSSTNTELIFVHLWAGGGGGNTSLGGGGGAYGFGIYKATDITGDVSVTVGTGGAAGAAGSNSVFNATNMVMTVCGGGNANTTRAGGGGGWTSRGSPGVGGEPFGNSTPVTSAILGSSIFGGGSGANTSGTANIGGSSIYGGSGGGFGSGTGGNVLYGGAGGTATGAVAVSRFGGNGGNNSVSPTVPGGGGAANGAGANGQVIVYTLRKLA